MEAIDRGLEWTTQGSTMLSLKRLAEANGVRMRGLLTTVDSLKAVRTPAILFFEGRHFVVLDSAQRNGEYFLRDPSIGRIVLNRSSLERMWRGEALEVVSDGSFRQLSVSRTVKRR
jgi:ATP-binding cassette subfamily B protein RaxB